MTAPRDVDQKAALHRVEACYADGEDRWTLICECAWEAWGFDNEEAVRAIHAAHVLDPEADCPVAVTA